MVHDYYKANYYGDNMVVVATGEVEHQSIVDLVETHFKNMPKESGVPRRNSERPIYIPALLMVRDDEMTNSNVGIFYDAPSWMDEDYYGFLLL